jgi:sortase A
MKSAPPRKSLTWLLRSCQIALLACAVGALGYCAFVLADTWIFQTEAGRGFDQARLQFARPLAPGAPAMDGLLGRLEIPRLGLSVVVGQGMDGATLRRAAGHIAGTALPGRSGNVGIAGHRDTLFRPLRNIQQGDLIKLTTLQEEYRYRVVSATIVSPADVTVLDSDGSDVLTLVTCYPFYFVGPAPDRFIVRAERVPGKRGDGI